MRCGAAVASVVPGGRVDPADASARDAAKRETFEEVGLPLDGAEYLGRIDDQEGRPTSPSGGLRLRCQ